MKKQGVLFLLLGAVLLLAACGPQEPIVEAPAADINLNAADLGAGYTLAEESDLTAILKRVNAAPDAKGPLTDANRRVFTSEGTLPTDEGMTGTLPLSRTQVIVSVMVYNAAGAAQAGLDEFRDAIVGPEDKSKDPGVLTQRVAFEKKTPDPNPGDQSGLWCGKMADTDANLCLFLARRLNVLVIVQVTQSPGAADLDPNWAARLGKKMIDQVPAATVK